MCVTSVAVLRDAAHGVARTARAPRHGRAEVTRTLATPNRRPQQSSPASLESSSLPVARSAVAVRHCTRRGIRGNVLADTRRLRGARGCVAREDGCARRTRLSPRRRRQLLRCSHGGLAETHEHPSRTRGTMAPTARAASIRSEETEYSIHTGFPHGRIGHLLCMDPFRSQGSSRGSQNAGQRRHASDVGQRFCRPELVAAPFSLVKTFSGAESRGQAGSASWQLGYRPGPTHRPYMKVASPSVVHPLCETGSVSTVFDSMETRINEVGPVTVGQHSAVRQDVRPVLNREPLLRRGRLTSSEQFESL